jgi:hypothetical protein
MRLPPVTDPKFIELDVLHGGRVTHKIIAEIGDERWFLPEEEEALKEHLFAIALEHDWTLQDRGAGGWGRTSHVPKPGQKFLATDDLLGLTLWQIVTM